MQIYICDSASLQVSLCERVIRQQTKKRILVQFPPEQDVNTRNRSQETSLRLFSRDILEILKNP